MSSLLNKTIFRKTRNAANKSAGEKQERCNVAPLNQINLMKHRCLGKGYQPDLKLNDYFMLEEADRRLAIEPKAFNCQVNRSSTFRRPNLHLENGISIMRNNSDNEEAKKVLLTECHFLRQPDRPHQRKKLSQRPENFANAFQLRPDELVQVDQESDQSELSFDVSDENRERKTSLNEISYSIVEQSKPQYRWTFEEPYKHDEEELLKQCPPISTGGDAYEWENYRYLFQVEKKYCSVPPDFLCKHNLSHKVRHEFHASMITLTARLQLETEILHYALALCDQYLILTTKDNDHQLNYFLLGATALFLACKVIRRFPPKLRYFQRELPLSCDTKKMLKLECRMVCELGPGLFLVTPIQLLQHMLRGCPDSDIDLAHPFCRYLFDLLLFHPFSALVLPSIRTAAAIYLYRLVFQSTSKTWPLILQQVSGHEASQLMSCVDAYAQLLCRAETDHLQLFKKYSLSYYKRISTAEQIKSSKFLSIFREAFGT